MNDMTGKAEETGKPGWMVRLLSTVSHKLLRWLCLCEWGMSPCETRLFMIHIGFGCNEAMLGESLMQMKQNDEQK